jgi:hypothetical protein
VSNRRDLRTIADQSGGVAQVGKLPRQESAPLGRGNTDQCRTASRRASSYEHFVSYTGSLQTAMVAIRGSVGAHLPCAAIELRDRCLRVSDRQRSLARSDEVGPVGGFQVWGVSLAEAELLPRALAVALVDGQRRLEVQVVGMNYQQGRGRVESSTIASRSVANARPAVAACWQRDLLLELSANATTGLS